MKRLERNAVLAGLRYLQYNLLQIPDRIFDILTDGNAENDANHLNAVDIDELCESINFADITFEVSNFGEFEVERVHLPINESTAKVCNETSCSNRHYFAVYRRDPKTGLADWQSDHATQELARTAAAAYQSGANSETCVLSVGTAFDGITLYGPFTQPELAMEHANNFDTDWHVVNLTAVK